MDWENEHFKREPKEIHRSVFGLSMALMPTRLQNAPRFLDDGQPGSYAVVPVKSGYQQVRWFMRFGSTGRGRSQALESKVRFADKPTGTRLLSPTQIIQCSGASSFLNGIC
jgi:hypothetical protein